MPIFSDNVRTDTPDTKRAAAAAAPQPPVSVALYVGGWVVLVAGILAFASHLDVPSFTQFTVGLASAGVVTSYYLRRLGLPPRWMNMGAVCLLALFLVALTGQGPFAELVPVEAQTSQDVLLASALALAATFYSFVLISDEAVLFSCVFSIALIGLTGTVELNWPLIASFLMFLAGAIFLLVHQNYLAHRPRGLEQPQGQSAAQREAAVQHLLRTQIGMALLCGMAAVLIGFCIAVPIQMAGKQMSLAGIIRRLNVSPGAGGPGRVPRRRGLSFDDPRRFEVGLGPVPDDPRVVLRVFGDEGFYWRGRTYGEYTGRGWIPGEGEGFEILQGRQLSDSGGQFRFVVPPARPDEALARAASARTVEHVYRPEGGFSSSILWAASEPRAVQIAAPTLRRRGDGSLALPGGGGGLGGLEGLGGGGLGRRDGPPPSRPSASPPLDPPTEYTVLSQIMEPTPGQLTRSGNQYDGAIVNQYLSDERDNAVLRSLARQAIGDAQDPYTKAERIRTFVAERCTYTLDAPEIPRGEDVTVHFLNVTQQGYCDLYATAVTVLCRYAGLPARVATGFVPGTPSALNAREWVLTGNDRHAWAEVYFAGYGWVPFDATAVTSTSGLTEAQEARAERNDWWRRLTARGPIPLVLSALALLILVGVIVTELAARFGPLRRRAAPGRTEAGAFAAPSDTNAWAAQIHRLYANTARAVGKRGGIGARQPATTPRAYVALARARIGETVAEPLRRLTDLAELALYGPTTLTERHVADARVLAKAVRAALKKVPRPRPRWWPWSLRFARADAADTSPQGAVHALPRR